MKSKMQKCGNQEQSSVFKLSTDFYTLVLKGASWTQQEVSVEAGLIGNPASFCAGLGANVDIDLEAEA